MEASPSLLTVALGTSDQVQTAGESSTLAVEILIVCCFADWLAPEYHSQGIMSAAVHTLLRHWALPRMHAKILRAATFAGNVASRRVFEKNGFRLVVSLEDHVVVRGERRYLDVLEWVDQVGSATNA